MKIVEIFNSIEGEGARAGKLCTFVRSFGCNLQCSYCDSTYACDYDKAPPIINMSISNILERVHRFNCSLVTLTGGEPTIQPEFQDLMYALIKDGFRVNVETNGSIDLFHLIQVMQEAAYDQLTENMFTMDIKCPSSGMSDKMKFANLSYLRPFDVVKFVVGSVDDLHFVQDLLSYRKTRAQIYLSPVFGKITLEQIVDFMKTYQMNNARLQVQLHKIIWDPNERGV